MNRHFSTDDMQMINKHIKKQTQPPLAIREMKTTMKYYLIAIRMATLKQTKPKPNKQKNRTQEVLVRMWSNWNPYTLLMGK